MFCHLQRIKELEEELALLQETIARLSEELSGLRDKRQELGELRLLISELRMQLDKLKESEAKSQTANKGLSQTVIQKESQIEVSITCVHVFQFYYSAGKGML